MYNNNEIKENRLSEKDSWFNLPVPKCVHEKLNIKKGYKWVTREGKIIAVHMLIWEENYGKVPKGYIIHHKNGIKTDNRLINLEVVTMKEHKQKHKEMRENKKCH